MRIFSIGLLTKILLLTQMSATCEGQDAVYQCSLCGDGVIGNMDGIVIIGSGMYSCAVLQRAADQGGISESDCPIIQGMAEEHCGCKATTERPTMPPSSTTTPSESGIVFPSLEPSMIQYAPETPTDTNVCHVCGEGREVSSPGRMVSTPMGLYTCAGLQGSGLVGAISSSDCAAYQAIAEERCACVTGAPTATDAPIAPSPPGTPAPSIPVSISPSEAQLYVCPICGVDMIVTRPNALVEVPTYPDRTCAELVSLSEAGEISEMQCMLLKRYSSPCGCTAAASMPTDAPTEVPTDQNVPTIMPALSPTRPPETDTTEVPTALPTSTPFSAPSPAPTMADTPFCFSDLTEIHDLERNVRDTSTQRKYVLCRNTTYALGFVDQNGDIVSGQKPIQLRPNVTYQCGEDGARSNDCLLVGGDFGLTSFYDAFDGLHETVDNVELQGLTFQSQKLFAVVLEAAGDVTFVDCAFQNQRNMGPIVIQWKGDGPPTSEDSGITLSGNMRSLRVSSGAKSSSLAREFYLRYSILAEEGKGTIEKSDRHVPVRNLQESNFRHVVTFKDCEFRENMAIRALAFPGIIENTFMSELVITNCLFANNDYGPENNPAPHGFAIKTAGPLTIQSTCFIHNTFRNLGPIETIGAPVEAFENYVESDQSDLECSFIARFDADADILNDSPTCINFDAETCSYIPASPIVIRPVMITPAPAEPPTKSPTVQPELESSGSWTNHNHAVLTSTALMLLVATWNI